PQHPRDEEHDYRAEGREVAPRRAGDEQHRRKRGHEDERGAEIRLDEDEEGRDSAERQNPERRPPLADRRLALGEQPGERENDEELPELRRLELEEAEVDPT